MIQVALNNHTELEVRCLVKDSQGKWTTF